MSPSIEDDIKKCFYDRQDVKIDDGYICTSHIFTIEIQGAVYTENLDELQEIGEIEAIFAKGDVLGH